MDHEVHGLSGVLDAYVHPHGFCLANFDPWLVVASDLGNLLVFGAYVLGVPFCAAGLFRHVPPSLARTFWLGVGFVYLCGISHLLDVIITHTATWWLYQFVTIERVVTGVVSWVFVLAVFRASRTVGLRVVAPAAKEAAK